MLRLVAILVSAIAHAALALPLFSYQGAQDSALDLGPGEDRIRIEVGQLEEGAVSTGQDAQTVAALDTAPAAAIRGQAAQEAVREDDPPPVEPERQTAEAQRDEPPPVAQEPEVREVQPEEPPPPVEPPPDFADVVESEDPPPLPEDPDDPVEAVDERLADLADVVTSEAEPAAETALPPAVAKVEPPRPLQNETPPDVVDEPPPPEELREAPPPTAVEEAPRPEPAEQTPPPRQVVEDKPIETPEEARPEQVAADAQLPQVAVREQVEAGAKQEGGKLVAEALQAHMGTMFRHVQAYRVYPRKKQGKRRTGEVTVAVTFAPGGAVLKREVRASSGDRYVDAAALEWVDKASPFPKFPNEVGDEDITIDIPFIFSAR